MSSYDIALIFLLISMTAVLFAAVVAAYHSRPRVVGWLACMALAIIAISIVITIQHAVDIWHSPTSTPSAYAAERSSLWRSVRAEYLLLHPVCEACGTSERLHVHHIVSFSDAPELELEYRNLITLCREHHFSIGHDPDGPWGPETPNLKLNNPHVWQDASRARNETQD